MPETTTELEDFIAHYGKKGMKWGVRRSKDKPERTQKEKNLRRRKQNETAKLAVGAATYLGLNYAARHIAKTGNTPLASAKDYAHKKSATKLIKNVMTANGGIKVSTMSRSAKSAAVDTVLSKTRIGIGA